MVTDGGRLNVEYLEQPGELPYEFAAYLAAKRIGRGITLSFYHRQDLEQAVEGFVSQYQSNVEQTEQVNAWMDNLPWDEKGRVTFSFTW